MIHLFSAALLLTIGLVIVFIHRRRPNFQFSWLIAAGGALTAFLIQILLRILVPYRLDHISWELVGGLRLSLGFVWDDPAWVFGTALVGVLVGALLTDVVHASEPGWIGWSGSLFTVGIALLAVFAGNLFTLLLCFTAIDLTILLVHRQLAEEGIAFRPVVEGFAGRTIGTGLVVSATLFAHDPVAVTGTMPVPMPAVLLILGGFFLRMGILPWKGIPSEQRSGGGAVGTVLPVAPVAAAMILLQRQLTFPLPNEEYSFVLLLLLIPALIAGLVWLGQEHVANAKAAWFLSFGIFASLSALRGFGEAGQSWGVATLLSGALIWLYSWRERWLVVFPLLGLWGLSSLPFSPTWEGAALYSPPLPVLLPVYLFLQGAIFAGYLGDLLEPADPLETPERWVQVIYPAGLLLLVLVSLGLTWLPWKGIAWLQISPWWPGLIATTLGLGIWFLLRDRWRHLSSNRFTAFSEVLFSVLRRFAGAVSSLFGLGIEFLTSIFEGRGGVLWALLVLILLISLLSTVSG